jgi:hypothetical protein
VTAADYSEPQLWTETLPAIAADDSIPSRTASRDAIYAAITQAAATHHEMVHVSWVRPLLPPTVHPPMIGAVMAGLHLSGHLSATTRIMRNGGPSGNASKLAKVSRLVKPIEAP